MSDKPKRVVAVCLFCGRASTDENEGGKRCGSPVTVSPFADRVPCPGHMGTPDGRIWPASGDSV